ncbi:MAG: ROK family protein [Candidatus Omnitrophica bacterium]|nr:ROK family protein [Candidatus Omnitrophota bacterium]
MSKYIIGIDVGGTNVKLGLVNGKGDIIGRLSFSTKNVAATPEKLTAAICEAAGAILRKDRIPKDMISGVGVGLPGLVDVKNGIVRVLPNIPGWKDVLLRKAMEKKLGLAVRLENDVNMIALGEWQYGAGKGLTDAMFVTLGTGVGAGLILNGAIYRGPGFAAGEIGHIPLNEGGPVCGCGGWGCFERYVGNQELRQIAAKMFNEPDIALEEIYNKAVEGKKKALKFWDMIGERVGNGLVGPVNLLNPQAIVVGGGVARSFAFLEPAIVRTLRRRSMRTQGEMVRVIKAQLDDDAGIIGARVLLHT